MTSSVSAPGPWIAPAERRGGDDELLLASRQLAGGLRQTELSVPSMHCGACMQRIETALGRLPGVDRARVNLSTRRASVTWRGETPPPLIEALDAIGFAAHLHDGGADAGDPAF